MNAWSGRSFERDSLLSLPVQGLAALWLLTVLLVYCMHDSEIWLLLFSLEDVESTGARAAAASYRRY